MLRLSEVLEVLSHIARQTLVEGAQIGRTEAKGISPCEAVKIVIDELLIETVIVGDEHGATLALV